MKAFLDTLLCLTVALGGGAVIARADMAPGVDWYISNAEAVEVVQAEAPSSTDFVPSSSDMQRVWVDEVLKGVDTTQSLLVPKGSVQPGGKALVLIQYEAPSHYEPTLELSRETQSGIAVWPMDTAANVDTGDIPAQTEGEFPGGEPGHQTVKIDVIKSYIAKGTPEQVGLNLQVLDALLFPAKFQTLAHQDPGRATFVRFTIALLDLNRNVASLARLLESPDQSVRIAGAKKLEALTHTPMPHDVSPHSLRVWSEALPKQASDEMRWPPVPPSLDVPPGEFPEPLIQAVQLDDADAFATEFASWLDSGVMRDRGIHDAADLDRKILNGSNLTGGERYLTPAPRLRPDVLLDTTIPAVDRMKAMALFAGNRHFDRFAQERKAAAALVASAPPGSDILRRAAFWELRDINIRTAGQVALGRLARSDDPETQRFLLGLCFAQHLDDDLLDVVQVELKAKRQPFTDGLFAYLDTHRDDRAQWMGRMLCAEGRKRVIPVMLAWLKDNDPQVRTVAALNLCWLPDASAVSALLDAIHAENNPKAREQMLVALAQTGDERGLETLLAAARETNDPETEMEIARGLGRIRDPKALETLADIVARLASTTNGHDTANNAPEENLGLSDAVNAFGYISHTFEAHKPDFFQDSSGVSLEQIKQGVASIEQWRKSHRL